MPYLLNAVVSGKSPFYSYDLVVLNPLVSLISYPVACSAKIAVDRQTDTHTHKLSTVTLAEYVHQGLIITLLTQGGLMVSLVPGSVLYMYQALLALSWVGITRK